MTTVCTSVTHAIDKIEKDTLKELNLKIMNLENERNERENRENDLILKIKAIEEEKNVFAKKLEANEKSINQLLLTMQNWEKREAKPEILEEMTNELRIEKQNEEKPKQKEKNLLKKKILKFKKTSRKKNI